MLGEARRRLREACWVQADGDRPWPVAPGRAVLIFLSRAAHLLAPAHLVEQVRRAAHPAGASFVIGRVRREPGSLRSALRRAMRRLLAAEGIEGRSGEAAQERLMRGLAERGATVAQSRAVASWKVVERPADSLASWRRKPGLAGTMVAPGIKQEALDRLEAWARERWGGLEAGREAQESYELAVAELPPIEREERG